MSENAQSTRDRFDSLIGKLTAFIAHRPLDSTLQDQLNRVFPFAGPDVGGLFDCCRLAVAEGWMCSREAGGIRFGRVVKPHSANHGFSVDVVDMNAVEGPHHRHPNGEIDLIMPLEPGARFDGHDAGWLVYGPGSEHSPTVSHGRALILYLLPQGAIEFRTN
jgi:uncharacterized protein DUF4863